MNSNPIRWLAAVSSMVSVLAVGGCGTTARDTQGPAVTAPSTSLATTTTPRSSTASTSVPEELTAEEQLRVNPPPPRQLSVVRTGQAVTVTWSPPPAVTVPHTYSDDVVEYRVYRSVDGGPEVLVGTTPTLTFTDAKPGDGTARYAVSSVREHGVEGPRTDAVEAPSGS